MKKALYITDRFDEVYPLDLQERVEKMVDVIAPPQGSDIVKHSPELLSEVEVIISGWAGPMLDQELLDAAPKLKAFFYAGGCTKSVTSPEMWERGVVVCSAIHANSIPVAEYTMAQIVLCLKQTYQAADTYRKDFDKTYSLRHVAGAYGGKVGLIGFGNVSHLLVDHLKQIDVRVSAYDPGVSAEAMQKVGVQKVSLEALFAESDVVSLHAPEIPATKGMITGELMERMKQGASLINTSRGSLIREDEMIGVLRSRTDLYAVLDVTDPEPPRRDSSLWTLPNILLTPHVAGSQGRERFRVGCMMVDDLERYLAGRPLKWRVNSPL